jgi:ribonuclease D
MLSIDPSQVITHIAALRALANELQRHPVIAVDTESNSLYAYRERVCLIQFSTPQADTLVDPLALDDLSPLAPIFADPHIEKIFHAAEYDLICLKRDFGFQFSNLFDTLVAARILGRKQVGLGAILAEEFKVEQDKRFQRANWGVRPLPPDHLTYAVQDTRYLIPLRERLGEQLKQAGFWDLAQEDFRRLCLVENHQQAEEDNWWHTPHANELTPQQAAVLQELLDYRDDVARAMNRPRFKVIGAQTLHAIAQNCPGRNEDLRHLPGMTPPQIRRHGRAILTAVQRGLDREPLYPPKPVRPDERYLLRLDALRNWRKQVANSMGVESDVVLPKDLMQLLAERDPRDHQAIQEVMAGTPWRLRRFGGQLDGLLVKRK